MVRNKDDASFVSWADTLHPESAQTSIDPRVQSDNGNPWATVYNDTCSVLTEDTDTYPVAVQVVAVDEETDTLSPHYQQQTNPTQEAASRNTNQSMENNNDGISNDQTTSVSQPQSTPPLQPWRHSNLIDLIIGGIFAINAIVSAVQIEISAFVVYMLAAGFHWLSERHLDSPFLLLLKAIFLLVSSILMFVDAILLIVSVLVTEILAGIAFFLCTLFGGPRSGTEWHQFIRRICHLTRWAFRSYHQGWVPERIFPVPMDGVDLPQTSSSFSGDTSGAHAQQSKGNTQYSDEVPSASTSDGIQPSSSYQDEPPPVHVAPHHVSLVQDEDLQFTHT